MFTQNCDDCKGRGDFRANEGCGLQGRLLQGRGQELWGPAWAIRGTAWRWIDPKWDRQPSNKEASMVSYIIAASWKTICQMCN